MALCFKSYRVFYTCMVVAINFIYIMFIEIYTSPIEDSIITEGILSVETYPLFSSTTFLGGIIGSSNAGLISEWLGIKTSLLVFSSLGLIGGVFLVWAHDSISMIIAKGLVGIYIGLSMSCVPVYVTEISPTETRNFYGIMLGIALRIGVLLSYLLCIFWGFHWLSLIYVIIIAFFNLNLVFLPESPRWLRSKGFHKKAAQASDYLYDSYQEISQLHLTAQKDELEDQEPKSLRQRSQVISYGQFYVLC